MYWKKRKKRNRIMKHYGFHVYTQYEIYLRIMNLIQHYKDKNWFTEKDRIMIAEHMIMSRYIEKWLKNNKKGSAE